MTFFCVPLFSFHGLDLQICESCSTSMEPYVDGLVEIYKMVLAAADARRGWGTTQPGNPQLSDQDAIMVGTASLTHAVVEWDTSAKYSTNYLKGHIGHTAVLNTVGLNKPAMFKDTLFFILL